MDTDDQLVGQRPPEQVRRIERHLHVVFTRMKHPPAEARCVHISQDGVDRRGAAYALGLGDERGLALLAMTAGEAVRSQPAHWWVLSHVDTPPMLGDDQSLALQYLQRTPDGHPRDAVMVHQLSLRGE